MDVYNIECPTPQDKLIDIPDKPKDWKPPEPPEFVRFYMGESNSMQTPPSFLLIVLE